LKSVRFSDSKAKYIVEARDMFSNDGKLQLKSRISSFYNPFELREWLVENVKGLGYKEASHFLRNIGLEKGSLSRQAHPSKLEPARSHHRDTRIHNKEAVFGN